MIFTISMTSMDVLAEVDNVLTNLKHAVIVGIGNELNGDDGFGIYLSEKLSTSLKSAKVFVTHTAPENFVSSIVKERPSHVIFLDVAAFDGAPGTIRLLTTDDLARIEAATHRIPLSKIIERLLSFHECRIVIIGVQPRSMDVGAGLSPEVRTAADELLDILCRILR